MYQGEILNFHQLLYFMANNHPKDQQYDDNSCPTCSICWQQQQHVTTITTTSRIQCIPQDEVKHETKTKIFTPVDSKTFFMTNNKRTYTEMNNHHTHQASAYDRRYNIEKEKHGVLEKRAKLMGNYISQNNTRLTPSSSHQQRTENKYTNNRKNLSPPILHNNKPPSPSTMLIPKPPSSSPMLLPKPSISPHGSESELSESGLSETCSSSTSNQEGQHLDNERHQQEIEKAKYERNIKLYQYIIDLLEEKHPCVMWISREEGMFKIVDSDQFARLWGEVKLNPTMNYEKLARSFRHYYKKGIMESDSTISKTGKRKLYYKFGQSVVKMYVLKEF